MNKRIIAAAMAAIALVACEKRNVELQERQDEMVTFEVSVETEQTKITGTGSNESDVSDYQIFIFNKDNGMLEVYEKSSESTVQMTCTTGPKEVVVIANAPDLSSVVSLASLKATKSSLTDNRAGKLVMEGTSTQTLTASVNTVNVALTRIVAKVCLKSVTADFELDTYDGLSFKILNAYLINVPADRSYLASSPDPKNWFNKMQYESNDYKALLYDDINLDIKSTRKYDKQHHFYSYPNPYTSDSFEETWSPRPTRLVVEAELGGVHYYYPVALPELKQNTIYDVSINIVRPGSTSPEEDMEKYAANVKITVNPWSGPVSVSENI
ncbi:MAG: DUF4906 domain-containing protein [Bacteroidales bacterium]|nr:DUF4906 domain-containing protein [Bacteroidales bacterium]